MSPQCLAALGIMTSMTFSSGPRTNEPKVDGVLLVDKITGITSHDVVEHVRRRSRIKKVGHTGTLDPLATGLLVLCLGKATRLHSGPEGSWFP